MAGIQDYITKGQIMNNLVKIIAGIVIVKIAFVYLLINLYANPVGYATPMAGAIGFLAFSILFGSVIYSIKNYTVAVKIVMAIESTIFLIGGFLSALICLYSLAENTSYPLASSILVLGSILPVSILIIRWNTKNEFSQP